MRISTKATFRISFLSTEAFLGALERFIAQIYFNNGTNFVGAARKLCDVTDDLRKKTNTLTRALASHDIAWKFQPAYVPRFEGLAEATVKSAKRLLVRMLREDSLYFEEYTGSKPS